MGKINRQSLFDQLDSIALDMTDEVEQDDIIESTSTISSYHHHSNHSSNHHNNHHNKHNHNNNNNNNRNESVSRSMSTSSTSSYNTVNSVNSTTSTTSTITAHTSSSIRPELQKQSTQDSKFLVRKFSLKQHSKARNEQHKNLLLQQQNMVNILDYLIDILDMENNQILEALSESVDKLSKLVPYNTYRIENFNVKFNQETKHI
ncbi:uncharacterized protein RJT21DRAFT_33348 [Scheffersomyces amazonensis]|uniref:uncharacterized protein n=1 Tax=Scheffersomyces amazonensis TaxID=1078765 RepID=UPI00315E01E3